MLGEALKQAYADLFHIREKPSAADREAIQGKFKTTHNVSDRVAEVQTATFLALLKLADVDTAAAPKKKPSQKQEQEEEKPAEMRQTPHEEPPRPLSLRYNIEIHLPATKDVEVYNAIFKSLRSHLGE